MAIGNPCAVMQALTNWELQVIAALNKKFAALQRLASLLEQMGDLNSWLPNLSSLIESLVPVGDLDLSIYTDLQVACPFLNLPPYSNEDLDKLKGQLNAAYATLLRDIANHPWARMDKLQDWMNDAQNAINYPYGADYLRCMNAVCGAMSAAGSTLSGLANTNIQAELTKFGDNFIAQGGEVLTEPMRNKRNLAFQTSNAVYDLRDETVQDYQTLTTSGETLPNKPPLRLGDPTGTKYTFDATTFPPETFPPGYPTNLAGLPVSTSV
jgi:hypothetical protein